MYFNEEGKEMQEGKTRDERTRDEGGKD